MLQWQTWSFIDSTDSEVLIVLALLTEYVWIAMLESVPSGRPWSVWVTTWAGVLLFWVLWGNSSQFHIPSNEIWRRTGASVKLEEGWFPINRARKIVWLLGEKSLASIGWWKIGEAASQRKRQSMVVDGLEVGGDVWWTTEGILLAWSWGSVRSMVNFEWVGDKKLFLFAESSRRQTEDGRNGSANSGFDGSSS